MLNEFITDPKAVNALVKEYEEIFDRSKKLMEIYGPQRSGEFWNAHKELSSVDADIMLMGKVPTLITMPQWVAKSMQDRAPQSSIYAYWTMFRDFFKEEGYRTISEKQLVAELSARAKHLCADLESILSLEEDEAENKTERDTIVSLKNLWDIAKKNHDKELERLAREKMYKAGCADDYFGNVGDKFEKELMFEKIIGFDGYYGYTYFVFFRDEEGHVFKWSTNKGTYQCWHKTNGRDAYLEYEVGKKYLIKGSVKEHSEYKGIKQTVITRCKVLKDEYETHVFNPKDIVREEKPVVESEDPFGELDIA
jgi:hypothetical protein